MSNTETENAEKVAGSELTNVSLGDEERAALAELEQGVVRAKLALADLDIQAMRMDTARSELRQKVADATKAYVDEVVAAAAKHGIDINDTGAKWNFDTNKMTFTRQD